MESGFEKWLLQQGAEILPSTNEYEEIRFKGLEVGVKYKSGKYSNEYAKNAFECYKESKKWEGKPIAGKRRQSYVKQKKQLIKRDGSICFYCGLDLGNDVTVEHLISLASGGLNKLSNMVLAHEDCNKKMGNKLLIDKVNFAIKNRKCL